MTKRIKKERIASIATGSVLFILAAIFTIAIFLRIFDYGTGSLSERGAFFNLGHMLYSAYGFCSLLIPLFFIVCGAFCFDSRWSIQRALCLIVSPLPFMTLVIAEKLIRSSLSSESHAISFVKITLLSVVTILLIAVEYLVTIILSGKLKKKLGPAKSRNVTSAPVHESDDAENQDEAEKTNVISRLIDALSQRIKNLTKKDSSITAAPTDIAYEDAESTVELVRDEENQDDYDDEEPEEAFKSDDEDDDDDSFREPTISDTFFEEKTNLLVDSGDNEINEIPDEDEPQTMGQTLARPFKKLIKKAQDKYRDIMDYGEIQDKENPALNSGNASGGKTNADDETEAVDINDFFKKPAERVVLKEDDYSDLDLPPRPKVQDTIISMQPENSRTTLEYDNTNPTVIVDEKRYDQNLNQDENQDDSADSDVEANDEIFNGESENQDESEYADDEYADFNDEEDIIDMFERQNKELEDNDFLNQLKEEISNEQKKSAEREPVGAFVDSQVYEDEVPEPVKAEKPFENDSNSFLSQLRSRVSARENAKSPAQLKAEQKMEQEAKLQAEKEEAERQKKLRDEKLYAQIREELKAGSRKKEEFNFVPDLKSEVSTSNTGLNDIFAKMNQYVKTKVESDPAYKAQFETEVESEPETMVQNQPEKNEAPVQKPVAQAQTVQQTNTPKATNDENLSEIQQRHKSFIARAEALKAAKEAEQAERNARIEQEKKAAEQLEKKPQVDYVFGDSNADDSSADAGTDNLDPLAGNAFIDDDIVVEDVSDDITPQNFLDDGDDLDEQEENQDESVSADSFLIENDSVAFDEDEAEDDEGDEEEYYDEDDSDSYDDKIEFQIHGEEEGTSSIRISVNETPSQPSASEPVDYVFQNDKPQPPKPSGWKSVYNIPYDLLTAYEDNPYWIIDDETKQAAENLKNTLAEFKIDAEVTGIQKGPVVTMFEILPAPGVKLNRIVALADNIALRLAANSVRIVAPIPGKHAVGIEVPNSTRATISIRECLEADRPEWTKMGVPVVLGKDIQGNTQIIDLVKTPHLLIAGATGAGKSVCVNSMIVSMLYKRSPRDVKMILIDPKIVELKLYNDIPHLLTPVITEPKKAMQALQYCLCEMERRYALLDGMSVREISAYNKKIREKHIATEKLPYLIVIIDEFADLMATTGKQLEGVLSRLAAMSRAVGIHIVLATQRPSIDVITGLIKANIPSRIAFMVASKIDSRIILDHPGAEKLLGKGDMLYISATDPIPNRIQGTFVSDQEVENIVEAVKAWGEPEYIDDEIFIDDDDDEGSDEASLFNPDAEDPLYEKALDIVVQAGKASASYIQRRLKIGYNRAARLVEEMEERGIVGPANGSKPREIIHMP